MTCGFTFDDIDGVSPKDIAAKFGWFRLDESESPALYLKDGRPLPEFVADRPRPWPFGE